MFFFICESATEKDRREGEGSSICPSDTFSPCPANVSPAATVNQLQIASSLPSTSWGEIVKESVSMVLRDYRYPSGSSMKFLECTDDSV